MRMWMINPKIMCREHLLGEFRELKMFAGILRRKCKIDNYVKNQLIEIKSIIPRWAELREEMIRRNYKPKMILQEEDLILDHLTIEALNAYVPREWSLNYLLHHSRKERTGCITCREKYQNFLGTNPTESPFSKILVPCFSITELEN